MKTKNLILAALSLLSANAALAQQTVKVSGEVAGYADSIMVTVTENEGYQKEVYGKQKFPNGKFELYVKTQLPRMACVNIFTKNKNVENTNSVWGKMKWNKNAAIRVMLDDNPLTVRLTQEQLVKAKNSKEFEREVVSGGKAQRQFKDYLDYMHASEMLADSLSYAEAIAWFDKGGIDDSIKELKAAAAQAKEEVNRLSDRFIVEHPDYMVSAALLAQKPYRAFSYTNSDFDRLYVALQNNTDTLHMNFLKRNLELVHRFGLGAMYKDFEGKTKDNQTVKVSTLMQKGNLTLIDLWASWCGPCRAAIPKVKAMYEKYGSKLQVISCSVDEKEAAWCKAEAEEKMPWPQLLASKETLAKVLGPYYALSTIPCLVLIDAEGKIVCVTNDPSLINDKLK